MSINAKRIFCLINVSKEQPRPNDFKGVTVSIEKAKKILGWTNKVLFAEGMHACFVFILNDFLNVESSFYHASFRLEN